MNGLYPRAQEFIRSIFNKTKEVRGAEIKANNGNVKAPSNLNAPNNNIVPNPNNAHN